MAKKKLRKSEEEDDDEFAPPPFDERQFYSTELELAKATMLAAVWGIIIALISTVVFAFLGSFPLGLAVGVLAALALKPIIDRLRLITRQLETMKWLGMFFSYFMCWLAFWVLLVNPPVMDLTPPQLRDRTPAYQELGGNLRLSVEVSENSGLNSLSADVLMPDGKRETRDDFLEVTTKLHQLDLNYTATGIYTYTIRAEDGTGRSSTKGGQTEIVASKRPDISLIVPPNETTISVDTPIYFNVTDNALISGVYYTLDSNPEKLFLKPIKSYQSYVSDNVKNNVYRIRPNAEGHRWSLGAHNLTITASDAANNIWPETYTFTII